MSPGSGCGSVETCRKTARPNAAGREVALAEAGRPEPENPAPFGDVDGNAWYAKAVAWAYEAGITKGNGTGFARAVGLKSRKRRR